MYNEERKLAFLKETRQSSDYGISVFNATKEAEETADKDLCELNAADIQGLFDRHFGVRKRATDSAVALMQSYVRWCREQGYTTSDGAFELDIDMSAKIRRTMVMSPYDLNQILNETFDPISDKTVDCLYRCYLWMAFIGIKDTVAIDIKVDQIDLDAMLIHVSDRDYDIYGEAAPALRVACEATEFTYKHAKYTTTRSRFPGSKLFRGVRSDSIQLSTIRAAVGHALAKKGYTISYTKLYLSGIFYKAYEAERRGFAVNFDEMVIEQLKSTDRVFSERYSEKKAARTIRQDFFDDYERWKQAFSPQ